MKKDTHTHESPSPDTPEKNHTTDIPADDALVTTKKEPAVSQKELDALALSAIESIEVAEAETVPEPDNMVTIVRPKRHDQWWKQRKVTIPIGVVVLLVLVLAIPATRYATLGFVWHKNMSVAVQDSKTGKGLKDATVTIGAVSSQTNDAGVAIVKGVSLGQHDIVIEKNHYARTSQPFTVDIFSDTSRSTPLVATGVIVPLQFLDRISGKAVQGAEVKSAATKLGKTSGDGTLDVVIPKDKKRIPLTITAAEFKTATIDVTATSKQIELTPTGNLYYLSKQSGKLDLVASSLDGTERKVIVAGTGSEDDRGTNIVASQDWKYIVLKSKRVANKPASLYIVTTADNKYTTLDDMNTEFTPIGWSGHHFIYQSARSTESWRANSMQLKSYDAQTGKTVTLDQNASDAASTQQGQLYEMLGQAYVVDGRIVYTKTWVTSGMILLSADGKQAVVNTIKPDGSDKKTIKSYSHATTGWISSRLYRPQQVYFQIGPQDGQQKTTFSELAGDVYKENITPTADYATAAYPSYLLSPNGSSVIWSEERDGKQAIFVGDKTADNKQEIAQKSEYTPYGWLTDTWILLQKNDSELYITTLDQLKKGAAPLKVSDYHRSTNSLYGYGYGG